MKKILFLFCLLFAIIGARGQSNVYHPFPDSNAVWDVHGYYGFPCQSGYATVQYEYFFYFSGTQTMGATTYQRLYRTSSSTSAGSCSAGAPYYSGLFGGIRQDIASKLVFIKFPNCAEDTLYNFNKSVGQSMTFIQCSGASITRYTEQINSIDSVLVGGQYHKRFNTVHQSCIEGIGSTMGFDYMGYNGVGNAYLQCFQHINDFYPANVTSCSAPAGIHENAKSTGVSIIPNPTSDKLVISSADGIETVLICDLLGKILVNEKLNGQFSHEFKLPLLSNGTYLVTVSSPVGALTRKINIIH